ncbi:hypothetical protein [Alicyclobacillus macrosporangiidus]|uniref:hypothetical protein n=1 Tax=Alicyclobacillus macrosporangiidus TaxID=392015 RepID=UPI00054D3A08|nr:hypothetical protein [Alicyclobacillus macrosporangiidus]
MSLDLKLKGAKRCYEQITVDTDAFERRLFQSLAGNDRLVKRKWTRNKKIAAIGVLLVVLPLAGFTYVDYFVWGGAYFQTSGNMNGPYSLAADPSFVDKTLTQPGTETFPLSQAHEIANFPIREPDTIDGWTRILSQGVEFPLYNYRDNELVSVTKTPFQYVDIYTNDKGQRVAVTQQHLDSMSKAYKKPQDPSFDSGGGVYWDFGKDTTQLQGFSGDLAWLVSAKWSDLKINKPGGFANVIVLHPETNGSVTEIVIDEYGGVSSDVLESFAHQYLQAPIK